MHIFPKRAFKTKEVADPVALDLVIQPIADKVAHGLNEHDIYAGEKATTAQIADGAYYAAYQVYKSVSPGWLGAPFYADRGGGGPDDVASVLDGAEWQPITGDSSGDKLGKQIETGEDMLFCIAQMQACSWKDTSGANTEPSDSPERLQYSLRLDGVVIEDTITGSASFPERPPREIYKMRATSNTNDFDFRHKFWQGNTVGINTNVSSARICRAFPVVEGKHTIEVAARRLPLDSFKLDNAENGSTLQIFNRRLFILRIKGWSKGDGAAPTLAVSSWNDGDVVSNQTLVLDRLDKVENEINDLGSANLQRGVFHNEHLPSMVVYPKFTTINPGGTPIINSVYPGFGVAGAGWTVVSDGAGTNLEVVPNMVFATHTGTIVVLANVQVKKITQNPDLAEKRVVAIFALRYMDQAGTWRYLADTEAALHNRNEHPFITGPTTMVNADDDCPLLWAIDAATLVAAGVTQIQKIQVIASTWDALTGAVQVDLKTKRAALFCCMLKGVVLG